MIHQNRTNKTIYPGKLSLLQLLNDLNQRLPSFRNQRTDGNLSLYIIETLGWNGLIFCFNFCSTFGPLQPSAVILLKSAYL